MAGREHGGPSQSLFVASTVNTQYKPGLVDGRAGSARFRGPAAVCELPLNAAT